MMTLAVLMLKGRDTHFSYWENYSLHAMTYMTFSLYTSLVYPQYFLLQTFAQELRQTWTITSFATSTLARSGKLHIEQLLVQLKSEVSPFTYEEL
jgi:hypothetical protein